MRCRQAGATMIWTVVALAFLAGTITAEDLGAKDLDVGDIVERYLKARGGVERWRRVRALELTGHYSTFSQRSSFRLVRRRDDVYRLDYTVMKAPAIRARGPSGPWMLHGSLSPEASSVDDGPYKTLLERESLFGLLLLDYADRGARVELAGPGEIDGVQTWNLRVTFASGEEEIWYLDVDTFLEVAVDSTVHDLTQSESPMRQRAFYDDFRRVDGLVLPFRTELEFGARLETMEVDRVMVDPKLDPTLFDIPQRQVSQSQE